MSTEQELDSLFSNRYSQKDTEYLHYINKELITAPCIGVEKFVKLFVK